uniref:Uncharacterized protein n=1 Tax=Aegilops tauschii subsp. strangulata TaxID=200361 RepID=A0A453RHX8_AEGTS
RWAHTTPSLPSLSRASATTQHRIITLLLPHFHFCLPSPISYQLKTFQFRTQLPMAAEPTKNDAHVVEIPVTGDGAEPASGAFLGKAASGHHPLGEIADSGGHLLLLKLWQREESRLNRRACALEAVMDAARRDAFYLCAAFLALHGLSLALLFAASVAGGPPSRACGRWWAPSSLSLAASLAL